MKASKKLPTIKSIVVRSKSQSKDGERTIFFKLDCGHYIKDQKRIKKFLEDEEYSYGAGGRTWPEECGSCREGD